MVDKFLCWTRTGYTGDGNHYHRCTSCTLHVYLGRSIHLQWNHTEYLTDNKVYNFTRNPFNKCLSIEHRLSVAIAPFVRSDYDLTLRCSCVFRCLAKLFIFMGNFLWNYYIWWILQSCKWKFSWKISFCNGKATHQSDFIVEFIHFCFILIFFDVLSQNFAFQTKTFF